MSGGTEEEQYVSPTNESYFAFSVQELFTISTDDEAINEEDDD